MKTKFKSPLFVWLILVFIFLANSKIIAQNGNGVTLYDEINQKTTGYFQNFNAGTYLFDVNHGWFNNSHYASSINVADGFEAWVCDDSSGPSRNGSNACSSYFEGRYNLNQSLSNKVSYLDVQYNKRVKTGIACLFAGFDTMGLSLCFAIDGTHQLANNKFEHPANFDLPGVGDWRMKASSIWVKTGYSAEVCTNNWVAFNSPPKYICKTYGAGEHNFPAHINNKGISVKITNERTRRITVPIKTPPVKVIKTKKS